MRADSGGGVGVEVSQSFLHSASWVKSYQIRRVHMLYHGFNGRTDIRCDGVTFGGRMALSTRLARTDNFWTREDDYLCRLDSGLLKYLYCRAAAVARSVILYLMPTSPPWEEDKVLWVEDANEFRFESGGERTSFILQFREMRFYGIDGWELRHVCR